MTNEKRIEALEVETDPKIQRELQEIREAVEA